MRSASWRTESSAPEIGEVALQSQAKRIVVRRYRAVLQESARCKMEKDANKMAENGYRLVNSADRSHLLSPRHGDVWATYKLVEKTG